MSRLRLLVIALAALAVPAVVSAQARTDQDAMECLWAKSPALGIESCSKVITAGIPEKQGVARMYRGKYYLKLSAYRSAADDFKVVLKTNPESPSILYGHGVALLHLRQVANGRAEIARAIAKTPGIADQFAKDGIPAPAYLKAPKAAKPR